MPRGTPKLNAAMAHNIRVLLSLGVSQAALAREYGVSRKVIWQIINDVSWPRKKVEKEIMKKILKECA